MRFLQRLTEHIPDLLHFEGTLLTIARSPYQDLKLEHIGSGPLGRPALSMSQLYGRGDDPEHVRQMCFEMELEGGRLEALHPYFYRDDVAGTIKTPIADYRTGHDLVIDERELSAEVEVAEQWSRNLTAQGFLEGFIAQNASNLDR